MSTTQYSPDQFVLVPVRSLRPNCILPFPVYIFMSSSNKMLIYRPRNTVLSKAKHEQMCEFPGRFYIGRDDMAALDRYLSSEPVSAMERLDEVVRSSEPDASSTVELKLKCAELLISHLKVDIDRGSALTPVEQAQKRIRMVSAEVMTILEVDAGILAKLMALQDVMNAADWDHSTNVATIAALLALAAGYTDRALLRDTATGGYLHDIGLTYCGLPPRKRSTEYQPYELRRFHQHPRLGLDLVETLNLDVSEAVKIIIYQHEECYDGGGFPMGVLDADIFEPAQIVSIASRFDLLIRVDEPGALTPEQALRRIIEESTSPGRKAVFNPMLLNQIFESVFAAGAMRLE